MKRKVAPLRCGSYIEGGRRKCGRLARWLRPLLGVYCDSCKPCDVPLRAISQGAGKTTKILGWVAHE